MLKRRPAASYSRRARGGGPADASSFWGKGDSPRDRAVLLRAYLDLVAGCDAALRLPLDLLTHPDQRIGREEMGDVHRQHLLARVAGEAFPRPGRRRDVPD